MVRHRSGAKRAARALARANGIPYSVARRRAAKQARETPPPGPPGPPDGPPGLRNIDDLLHSWVEDWCARQLGEPISENLWPDPDLPDVNAILGVEIDEPTVHELTADRHGTYSTAIEGFEGGSVLSSVAATARLVVDGLMDRGSAAGAVGGLVDMLHEAWNDHYSSVVARTAVEVELEFSAMATPDLESVENFEFVSAIVRGREQR